MASTPWMIVAGDFYQHGGMDRANYQLAKYVASQYPLTLVSHRVADDLVHDPHVSYVRVPRPFGKHLLGQPLLARTGWKTAKRLAKQSARIIVNGGNCAWPDVNWVHIVHAAHAAPVTGRNLNSIKIRLNHKNNIRQERNAMQKAKLVVCNSQRTANDVIQHYQVSPDRVRIVYLGINPDQFPVVTQEDRTQYRKQLGLSSRPWIGFVGQLGNYVKGFDLLYDAWLMLCRRPDWDANLLVIGSGASLPAWQKRAETDGIADRIQFLGFRTDVQNLLACCDAMIQPSRYDSYGLAMQEGICRGLPVIVSKQAGISERYPTDLADLIIPDVLQISDIAERLQLWRKNMDRYHQLIQPLSDQLRSYCWDDMSRDFVAAVNKTSS